MFCSFCIDAHNPLAEEKDGECGLGCTGNVDQIGTIEIRMHRVVIEQIVDGDEKDYIASKLTHALRRNPLVPGDPDIGSHRRVAFRTS